jgi:hypothetical protein
VSLGGSTDAIRRAAIPIAVVVALALPSPAGAAFKKFYVGPVGSGANNAGIEFNARFHSHKAFVNGKPPTRVLGFRWFNVPVPPMCADSFAEMGFDMKVNNRKFHGSFKVPQVSRKAIVHATFKHHYRKAVGTLDLKGSFTGGCTNADTGDLHWTASKGG